MRLSWIMAWGIAATVGLAPLKAADPPQSIKLVDGDRIVYLGNTFAERDAKYGYLETWLTADHPDITFTFRNLGWSGDTVWGDARARFGTRADGFQHLKEHVLALKPTILLVAYGMNESFAGEAGLADFEKGLNTLLDTLAETKAKIVLISPIAHEDIGPPLPSPERHNLDLRRYLEAMKRVADSRKLTFINLFGPHLDEIGNTKSGRAAGLTDDGIHLTKLGYEALDGVIASNFARKAEGGPGRSWLLKLKGSEVSKAFRVDVSDLSANEDAIRFRATSHAWTAENGDVVSDRLQSGRSYKLRIDGKEVGSIKAQDYIPEGGRCSWDFDSGEYGKRWEQLRQTINQKNELYFYRWRPQNETYLFGFRKHEQGNNGREIPLFDPLVAEKEAEIARLKKPLAHTYELIREEAAK